MPTIGTRIAVQGPCSAASGWTVMAAFLALWNVLFNLYPMALQRHNRARLRQSTSRRKQRAARDQNG
jgi:hypothetical protein